MCIVEEKTKLTPGQKVAMPEYQPHNSTRRYPISSLMSNQRIVCLKQAKRHTKNLWDSGSSSPLTTSETSGIM